MFDEEKKLILTATKKDITSKVFAIFEETYYVKFESEKVYPYNEKNLIILNNPTEIKYCTICTAGKELTNVVKALRFTPYVKVFFQKGTSKVYHESELTIKENLLLKPNISSVFSYLVQMASILTISEVDSTTENDDESCQKDNDILKKIYDKLDGVAFSSVINYYVNGLDVSPSENSVTKNIFPYDFNLSQKKAVNNAFSNKISVIEGPPGTGKSQSIINIIANSLISNKTVAVVSNNNSATNNIYDKLEAKGLGSICAKLGKKSNVTDFIKNQINVRPYPKEWQLSQETLTTSQVKLDSMANDIETFLKIKNDLAIVIQELDALKLEQKYFLQANTSTQFIPINLPDFTASRLHELFIYLNSKDNRNEYFSHLTTFLTSRKFKTDFRNLFTNKINIILDSLENEYYKLRINELEAKQEADKNLLEYQNNRFNKIFKEYTNLSLKIFKHYVYEQYNNKNIYTAKTLKNTNKLVKDYPVILSTTYSLLNCIDSDFMFDYIIFDESSQVDIVSAFPVLAHAKNVVVVGDSKQLPNIVDNQKASEFDAIFASFNLNERFNYTKNNLLSLTKKIENLPEPVILREHYRCHPKIIEFCNKKFYDNMLIILSDNNTPDPIKQYKCVKGNHARRNNNSWFNDRQAEIIKNEIITEQKIDITKDSVGIITPYKEQKNYLKTKFDCSNLEIDTVHGFQGREKDTIIFSTVANNINKFLDNPNSINVAISRAINKFYIVTPYEYKSANNSNLANFLSYIKYNNFEINTSKITSIYDLLYKVNDQEREKYLNTHIPFSRFASETITYNTILDILKMPEYSSYGLKDKVYPLRKLVQNENILTSEEIKFKNTNSHVDFLIYNKFDNQAILAIEVDGFRFHNFQDQKNRDRKKDSILNKCNIPVLRLKTNECREKERIIAKLDEVIKSL